MEVIRNGYQKTHICYTCNSEFAYTEDDLHIGEFGNVYATCPVCNTQEWIDEEPPEILTKDNIRFPTHFGHVSKENGAVDYCTPDTIQKYIKRATEFFRDNKDECLYYIRSGNLCVCVVRIPDDEAYDVIVTNNYYVTNIPFEKEDYEVNENGN